MTTVSPTANEPAIPTPPATHGPALRGAGLTFTIALALALAFAAWLGSAGALGHAGLDFWCLLSAMIVTGVAGWLFASSGLRLQARIAEADRNAAAVAAELDRTRAQLAGAVDRARVAERAKSHFLSAMSHELRTPLNGIIGFAEILEAEMLGPLGRPEYLEYSSDIRASGYQLLRLVNDILDISRADSGGIELNKSPLDVADVVRSVVTPLEAEADRSGIRVSTEFGEGVDLVHADERRLRQMLTHLVTNGIKFTPEGGKVTITVTRHAGTLVIAVTDTGIGIAREQIAHVLTPFGQVDNQLSRKYQGAGLGLPLTRSLITLHAGTFTLDSSEGKGTVATLSFPDPPMASAT